ncbi:MAG: hypothetical protein ABMA64_28025, partial [Myxococcota bacterium]
MPRVTLPELFSLRGRSTTRGGVPTVELRWRIHPSIGLPLAPFQVWVRDRFDPQGEAVRTTLGAAPDGSRRVLWDGRAASVVTLTTRVGSGQQLVLRAMSGPDGGGVPIDEVTASAGVPSVTLAGSVIRSVVVIGAGSVEGTSAVWTETLVNDPEWRRVERVGLPIEPASFDGTGYDAGDQGPDSAPTDPRSAAIARVKAGMPVAGWPDTTDLGERVAPWVPVEPEAWVDEIAAVTLPGVAQMLRDSDWPIAHEAYRAGAGVAPLHQLLLGAGADAVGALALGFGATVAAGVGLVMVTVDHQLRGGDDVNLVKVVLADVYLQPVALGPPAPAVVLASPSGLDRPVNRDEPWLASVELSWARAPAVFPDDPRPVSHAIVRGPELVHAPRASGGVWPFVAVDGDPRARRVDEGRPEPRPGESGELVYAVASQDWFGRWSGWSSARVTVLPVGPAVPALSRVGLELADGGEVRDAVAVVDFGWDWSDRAPNRVELQLGVHAPGTPPPGGSNRALGGPGVPDVSFTFGPDPDVPPSGLERLPPEPGAPPDARTYRARVAGFRLAFDGNAALTVSGRARADEAYRPGAWSGYGPERSTTAHSPLAPAPVWVPAAMTWASVPDPAGVARARLGWAAVPGAASYVVYTADEGSILRELGAPAPDLRVRPADRLPTLRAADAAAVRRAFRRLDRVTALSLDVDLPRGSHAIYCFAVVPVSPAGVEGPLPVDANGWIAVAAPRVVHPPAPRVRLRPVPGGTRVVVEVDGPAPASVELYRATALHQVSTIDRMGPPVRVWSAADAVATPAGVEFALDDTSAPPWVDVTYRAVGWAAAAQERGELAGRTVGPASSTVVPAAAPPALSDLSAPGQTGPWRLVQLGLDAPRTRCRAGVHQLSVAIRSVQAPSAELRQVTLADAQTFPAAPAPE